MVSSSLAEANVSHVTVAPVCALNFAAVDSNQAFCSVGYCALVPMKTVRVLPAPESVPPPELLPPLLLLQAARATATRPTLPRAATERIVV